MAHGRWVPLVIGCAVILSAQDARTSPADSEAAEIGGLNAGDRRQCDAHSDSGRRVAGERQCG